MKSKPYFFCYKDLYHTAYMAETSAGGNFVVLDEDAGKGAEDFFYSIYNLQGNKKESL